MCRKINATSSNGEKSNLWSAGRSPVHIFYLFLSSVLQFNQFRQAAMAMTAGGTGGATYSSYEQIVAAAAHSPNPVGKA